MILSVYNLALLILLVAGLPFWIVRVAATRKYREGLVARLGFVPRRLLRPPDSRLVPRPVLWLHAVSVGEVLAVSRLVAELDRALTGYRVLVSTTTRTGQALARERFGPDRVFYCPLDLPWAVRAYLNALRPALLILAETEFWPNLLAGCRHRGIPVAVVNARISDRSWPRYRRLHNLWRPFLSEFAAVLAQTELDADRLRALGCRPERVSVAGNLKFDVRVAREAEATRQIKACASRARFLVAGSTLEGEESALLTVFQDLAISEPSLILVLAPRHPERFAAVAALVGASGLPLVRRSTWKDRPPDLLAGGQVVLLDSIGELASIYSLAAVAFVGGSLVPAGGHNPLEPAQFGIPIVMGPHYANFRAVTSDLLARQALRIASRDELRDVLFHLLYDRSDASAMGKRARQAFEEQSGATMRCVEAIAALLAPKAVATHAGASGMSVRRMLAPLTPLYRLALVLRARRLASGREPIRRLRFPVVSIGNLSTGGAGKTPLAIALAQTLTARGVAVDVLSRGYGRSSRSAARVIPAGSAEDYGDEPLLIARSTQVPVYVAPQRYDAGVLAETEMPIAVSRREDLKGHDFSRADSSPTDLRALAPEGSSSSLAALHLLDDGFQHRQLHRDLDILLLSRADLNDRLLPAGNLREPLTALHRAHVIAIPADDPALESDLRAHGWQGPIWRLRRPMEIPPLPGPVLAFCGIARPEQFFAGLKSAGTSLAACRAFPDHHHYTHADLERLAAQASAAGATALLTTEKDAVRLEGLSAPMPILTASLRTEIEDEKTALDWLLTRIGSSAGS